VACWPCWLACGFPLTALTFLTLLTLGRFLETIPHSSTKYYDKNLGKINGIVIPPRPINMKIVYHLYIVFAKNRDNLLNYCKKKGIEAKIHYPVPIYLQNSLKYLNYKKGDFPVADSQAKKIISFPCDQHLSVEEMDYVIKTVSDFYKNK
jgi:dTDP-4-amino-4,6-dideoxygalactose transaminase